MTEYGEVRMTHALLHTSSKRFALHIRGDIDRQPQCVQWACVYDANTVSTSARQASVFLTALHEQNESTAAANAEALQLSEIVT